MIIYQPSNSKNNYNYNGFLYENCSWRHHFHKNLEVVAVLDGELDAIIDGRSYCFKKGSYVLILPNMLHYYSTSNYSKVWISVFSSDYVPEFESIIKGHKKDTPDFICEKETIELIERYIINKDNPEFFMLKAGLTAICGNYLKDARLIAREEPKNDISYDTIKYIEENFTKDVTMRDVAGAIGYEYHYFSRIFSQIFMVNFKTLVNQYRVDYAQRLLSDSNAEITEIALKCGFGSIRNFNRVFKDIMKEIPKDYRLKRRQIKTDFNR